MMTGSLAEGPTESSRFGTEGLRVLLSTLTTVLLLAVSVNIVHAQEELPDGVFTFTFSPDEPNWFWQRVYSGANGYEVSLIRFPPDPDGGLHDNIPSHGLDEVIRVQSGTLYVAFSADGRVPTRAEAKAYGPGSFIVQPAGIEHFVFGGEEEVIVEVTHIRNIANRSSE